MTPKLTIIVLVAWALVQLVWHPGIWWVWVLCAALLGGGLWGFFAHQRSRRTNWGVALLGDCPKFSDCSTGEPKGLFRLDLNDIILGELPTDGHRVLCQQLDITLPDGRIMQVRRQAHGSGLKVTFEPGEMRQVKRYRARETINPSGYSGVCVNVWGQPMSSCW